MIDSDDAPPARPSGSPHVDLYWIPLGAGARVVRYSGKLYEAVHAATQRRRRCDLYHSALVIRTTGDPTVIEMTPVPDAQGRARRGVVAEGPVGSRWLGPLRVFRYEIRCWTGGSIADLSYAVDGPVTLTPDPAVTAELLAAVRAVPTPVWGRDELGAGDMWNSNSVISWVLSRAGIAAESLRPPAGGRAPGWRAGVLRARSPSGSRS